MVSEATVGRAGHSPRLNTQHAENALQDLADVAMQLQEAITAVHADPGMLKVRHKLFSLSMGIFCYTNIH